MGGLPGRSVQGRRIRTREVGSIDRGVGLNRALWVLAVNRTEDASSAPSRSPGKDPAIEPACARHYGNCDCHKYETHVDFEVKSRSRRTRDSPS